MKTISLTYISHPTNGKLKLSCADLKDIIREVYSEEVNVNSSFFYEEDATLIYYLLKQLIAKSNNDQLFIIENIPFDMLRSMQYAYHEAGKPNTLSKYSFLEFKDGELKAFNQTLSKELLGTIAIITSAYKASAIDKPVKVLCVTI